MSTITPIPALLLCALGAAATAAEPLDCVMNPNATVELGSFQDGVLEELLVSRGDRVSKGQPLARLEQEMEQINAELARLRAESDVDLRSSEMQSKFRSREMNRLGSLREQQSVSTSAFEQAEIEYNLALLGADSAQLENDVARAEYARAQAQLARRTITSPVDGLVVDVTMAPGEYVHEQATLMNLAALDPLFVEVYVPVSAYGDITPGTSAVVRPEEPIGGEYQATVAVVDRVFDAASRTFGIRLELQNPDFGLPAGVRCTVSFAVAENPS